MTSREYATDVELLLLRFVDDNIEVNKLEISTHKYGKNTFKLIKPGHPSKLTFTVNIFITFNSSENTEQIVEQVSKHK